MRAVRGGPFGTGKAYLLVLGVRGVSRKRGTEWPVRKPSAAPESGVLRRRRLFGDLLFRAFARVDRQVALQGLLQPHGVDVQADFAALCDRDVARLLRDDDDDGVRNLAHADRCAVPRAERLGHVALRHREDALGRHDPVALDQRRAVVQRGVLEEDVLDQRRRRSAAGRSADR